MKKLYFILLLSISVNLQAQYKSLYTDSAQYWNVYNHFYFHTGGEFVDSLYISNDTLIKGKIYKTIISEFEKVNFQRPYGFLREDTNIGKAWFIKDTAAIEYLIYDLSLMKGDTFKFHSSFSYTFIIDTVYYRNSRKFLKLHLQDNAFYQLLMPSYNKNYYYDTLLFIEGIGSSRGFDNRIYSENLPIGHSNYLLCAFQNNQQVHQHNLESVDTSFTSCGHNSGTLTFLNELDDNKTDISITPNPAVSELYFTLEREEPENIYLIDIRGRIIKISYEKAGSKDYKIDISHLKSGIYFLKVMYKDGKVAFGKVVKQ